VNVDHLAGRAGHDLRESVRVDVDAELAGFHRAAARRRRTNASLVVATVLLALLAVTGLARWLEPSAERSNAPVAPPTDVPSSSSAGFGTGVGCDNLRVACRGSRTSTIYLDVPFMWTLPRGFGAPYSGELSSAFVETYLRSAGAGVTVLEHVSAATGRSCRHPRCGRHRSAARPRGSSTSGCLPALPVVRPPAAAGCRATR
jgi:hypothetical protein